MKPRSTFALRLLIATTAIAGPAAAQDAGWTGALSVYGWLPTVSGTATLPRSGLSTDLSSDGGDILEALNYAFFANGELRKGSWAVFGDLVATELSSAETRTGPAAARVKGVVDLGLFTLGASWRAYEDARGSIDLLGIGRITHVGLDISATGGGGAGARRSASRDETWFDPLFGLRGRYALTEDWGLRGSASAGGFGIGSEMTWDLYAGVTYAFSERWVGEAGYRFLAIDYQAKRVDLDVDIHGPVIGLTMRF
ncbi:hypothetical protein SAMN05444336_10117 [Albimonas donghaensis]|uniref:Outer membrane protein beta-barrel domain-containing protein n=1 Tax=Albimonas donghaensis TaxID=356660 RepID=A0A1H2QDP6_9RHOB|nr:hypothetical protein [Albimonas donghaensis]SDW05040.1 hypothetical protein SAMN05444336_10117 [Albimonas donghaensis]